MTKNKRNKSLFLSYASEDESKVDLFYDRLIEEGFQPWMDRRNLLPGEIWETRLIHAVREAELFIAFLSRHSTNKRGFLQKEIRTALDEWQKKLDSDIYLIPVRLEECEPPPSLKAFQYVDIFREEGWSRLCKSIRAGLKENLQENFEAARRKGAILQNKDMIKLPLEVMEGIPVISPKGFLDSITSEQISNLVTTLIDCGYKKIIIDFENIILVNSIGIGIIIEIIELILKQGGDIAICTKSKIFKELFEMTGISKYIIQYNNKNEAINSFLCS